MSDKDGASSKQSQMKVLPCCSSLCLSRCGNRMVVMVCACVCVEQGVTSDV